MPAATPTPTTVQAAAWNEYLERCRSAQYNDHPNTWQYEEIEAWAWATLQRRLRPEHNEGGVSKRD